MNTLFIIGMPGSGKSSFGRKAADRLGVAWHDMDVYFQDQTGVSPGDFIRARGETQFRDQESGLLKQCVQQEAARGRTALILSTGGGVVEREDNIQWMRKNGLVAYLQRPIQNIADSVALDGQFRPLLSSADELETIWRRRRPLYQQASHFQVENSGSFPATLDRLVALSALALGQMDYGVIGDPIAHSLSPRLHQVLCDEIGETFRYDRARIRRADLDACLKILRGGVMGGVNVTSPLKIAVLPLLDEIRGDARVAGAVNTVRVEKNRLIGYNTDMEGLRLAIERRGREYPGAKIVILGSGGAAAGITGKARAMGAREILVAARNRSRAESIVKSAGCPSAGPSGIDIETGSAADPSVRNMETGSGDGTRVRILPFPGRADAGSDLLGETDILINATTLGASGREGQPPEKDFESLDFLSDLPPRALVCDLIYHPAETRLIRRAKALGLETMNGLDMLIFQGILAAEIFLDRPLDRWRLCEIARAALFPGN